MEHKEHKAYIERLLLNLEIARAGLSNQHDDEGGKIPTDENDHKLEKRINKIKNEVAIFKSKYGVLPDIEGIEKFSDTKDIKRGPKGHEAKWNEAYRLMRTRLKKYRHVHEDKNGKLSKNSLFKRIESETGIRVKTLHNNFKNFPRDIKNLMK